MESIIAFEKFGAVESLQYTNSLIDCNSSHLKSLKHLSVPQNSTSCSAQFTHLAKPGTTQWRTFQIDDFSIKISLKMRTTSGYITGWLETYTHEQTNVRLYAYDWHAVSDSLSYTELNKTQPLCVQSQNKHSHTAHFWKNILADIENIHRLRWFIWFQISNKMFTF